MKISTALIKELRDASGAGILACREALQAHDGDVAAALGALRREGQRQAEDKAERETGAGLVVLKTEGDVTAAVHAGCETDFVARTAAFRDFAHRLADKVLGDPALDTVPALLDAGFDAASDKTVAATVRDLVLQLGENVTVDGVARYVEEPGRVVDGYVHAGAIEGYGAEEGRAGVLVEVRAEDGSTSAVLRALAHDLALHIAAANPRYLARFAIPAGVLAAQREQRQAELAGDDRPPAIREKIVSGRLRKWQEGVVLLEQPFVRDPQLTVGEWLAQAGRELGTAVEVSRFARFATDE
jgi:elongation factor Ts